MKISRIGGLIRVVRGQRIILDADLAALYGVTTGNLNKSVRRNSARFPPDFMFQLTDEEALVFQFGRSKEGRGGSRFRPYAFTEHGVAMLSSVLNSERAYFPAVSSASSRRTTISLLIERRSACARFSIFS